MEPHSNAAHGNAIPLINLTRRLERLDRLYLIEGAEERIAENWNLIHFLIDHPTDERCDMRRLADDIIEARHTTDKMTSLGVLFSAPHRRTALAEMFV